MLNREEAEKLSEEIGKMKGWTINLIRKSDALSIIDQFTEPETDQPFEIPVMQVFRNGDGELDFAITGGKVEDWHLAIATNAAAIKECKWVTCDKEGGRFWRKIPTFGKEYIWNTEKGLFGGDFLRWQYVHPSFIPDDCSRAIVRIEHVDS